VVTAIIDESLNSLLESSSTPSFVFCDGYF